MVQQLVIDCDGFLARVCNKYGLKKPEKPIDVYINPDYKFKNEAFPFNLQIAGAYFPDKKIIVLKTTKPFDSDFTSDIFIVFKHEVMHAIIDLNRLKIPLWLNEGLAVFNSRGFSLWDGRELLGINKKKFRQYLKPQSFHNPVNAPISYSLACGLVSYMESYGIDTMSKFFKNLQKGYDFKTAFFAAFGIDFNFFLLMFRDDFLSRYTMFNLIISFKGLGGVIFFLSIIIIFIRYFRNKKRIKKMVEDEKNSQIEPYVEQCEESENKE
ncbi:peptidase MA family metallohydrolase [Thermotomaculum hydrothermale]|uniref:peptidase MA family metallohydrolase n=1 Tax=Thermotomaculum hydrothermale TaxID=981385 RepID=UPI0019150AFF|nr:hypothetical protein [Thermotomaculum hydrothermale]